MKIYTLVEKTYDYYEFVEFITSSCDVNKIKNKAKELNEFIPLLFDNEESDLLLSTKYYHEEMKHFYVYVTIDN